MSSEGKSPFLSTFNAVRPGVLNTSLFYSSDPNTAEQTIWATWWLGAATGDATVTPGAGSLTLTGFAPTVTAQQNATVTPGAGSLTLAGFAPTVTATQSQTVTPGTGALVITGYAPTVTVPTSVTVEPGTGSLTITGYAPTVTSGADITLFDTHDGVDYEAREKREKDERRKTREAIEAAMRDVLRLKPEPDAPVQPPTAPPKPLDKKQVRALAAMLSDTTPAVARMPYRKLESQIRAVEEEMRRQAVLDREIEEEDEMILLLVA